MGERHHWVQFTCVARTPLHFHLNTIGWRSGVPTGASPPLPAMAVASALSGPPCCPLVHQNTGCSVLKDEVGAQAPEPAWAPSEQGWPAALRLPAAPARCKGLANRIASV